MEYWCRGKIRVIKWDFNKYDKELNREWKRITRSNNKKVEECERKVNKSRELVS